jgi:transcriptional regulator with XRE-family HTH domain
MSQGVTGRNLNTVVGSIPVQDMPQDTSGPNRLPPLPGETDTDELFGRRLRDFRIIAGLTQRQLAERMVLAGFRMHQTTIAKTEAAERSASIGEAVELARILGVNLTDLVTEPGSGAAGELAEAMAEAMAEREHWSREARDLERVIQLCDHEMQDALSRRHFAKDKLKEAMARVEELRVREGALREQEGKTGR